MKYPIKYNIEHGEFTKEQLEKDGVGGADNVVVISIMGKFGEGPMSTVFMSGNGATGESLTPDEQFRTWALWAHKLSEDPDLSPGKRLLCLQAFEVHRDAVMAARTKH